MASVPLLSHGSLTLATVQVTLHRPKKTYSDWDRFWCHHVKVCFFISRNQLSDYCFNPAGMWISEIDGVFYMAVNSSWAEAPLDCCRTIPHLVWTWGLRLLRKFQRRFALGACMFSVYQVWVTSESTAFLVHNYVFGFLIWLVADGHTSVLILLNQLHTLCRMTISSVFSTLSIIWLWPKDKLATQICEKISWDMVQQTCWVQEKLG